MDERKAMSSNEIMGGLWQPWWQQRRGISGCLTLKIKHSAGLTHSTFKVYVAAISAYHTSLGGQS